MNSGPILVKDTQLYFRNKLNIMNSLLSRNLLSNLEQSKLMNKNKSLRGRHYKRLHSFNIYIVIKFELLYFTE